MINSRTIWTTVVTFVRQKPLLSAGVVVVLLILLGLTLRSATADKAVQHAYHTVERGDFLISIVEGGTLKAVNDVTVRSELEGSAAIISIVPEGTYVKQGDLLVELDASDIKDRLQQQEVAYQNSQFAYVQAKESLSIQKSVNDSNIKDAELRVEFAKSDLEKYKEGDWLQQKRKAESLILLAEVELRIAKDTLAWTVELEKKGYETRTKLESDKLAVQQKEIKLEESKEDLRLLTKYDYPKQVRRLQSAVEQAEVELLRIKQRSDAQIASYEADLETRERTLELNQRRLEHLKLQLDLTKITAPQDGLVIYASSGDSRGSGYLIEEGATVRQKQDIIKLPDVSELMLEIRVHESHVQQIRPGLRAFLTIDSLPDRQFKGSVRKVGILPDSTSRYYNPNLKVYLTEVLIEDQIPDLKPGISGRAEIVITNLTKVLKVPIQAVTTVKGKQVCFVKQGDEDVPTPVEVGLYNDKFIEIKSGLKEGDQVLLSTLDNADNINLGGSIVNTNEIDLDTPADTKSDDAKKEKKTPVKPKVLPRPPPSDSSTTERKSRPDRPSKPTRSESGGGR
ncbi:MAG: efflux RND transporter periplasmic adaptor subunit [Verrucomicrobiota bacterium]